MSVPLLPLGSSTIRSNPSQSTSCHCKINRSSGPNKTQISEKKYEAIRNHAYKRSKKIEITFMDRSSSDPNKHTAKRVTSNRSPRDHCIENQKERRSHLATDYGPVGLWWTTHASSERHQWGWWIPPWWCLDWISWFWNLRRLELCFVDSPRVSGILGSL